MKFSPYQKEVVKFLCVMTLCLSFGGVALLMFHYIKELIPEQQYTVTVDDVTYKHCTLRYSGTFILEDKTILIPGQNSTVKMKAEN